MILKSFVLFFFLALKLSLGTEYLENKCLANLNVTRHSLSHYVDLKQNQCNNFYNFSCGRWLQDVEKINYYENKPLLLKNIYDFEVFKKKLLRGDFDFQSQALRKINKMIEKCEVKDESEKQKCLTKVEGFAFYAYASLYINELQENKYFYYYDIIEKLFDANVHELKQLIEQRRSFMNAEIRKKFYRKLNVLKYYKGYHQRLRDVNLMERCYRYFEISKNETYNDMLNNLENYECMIPDDHFDKETCINYVLKHQSDDVKLSDLVYENAYYHYDTNRFIVNPAIIRHPCFDCRFTKSLQYGCLGFIIGQELINGLDHQLRTYDYKLAAEKNNNQTTELEKTYYTKRDCFVKQFDIQTKNSSIKNNDKDSLLNEIIADIGGIRLAHKAYLKYLKDLNIKNEDKVPGFDNLSSEQLFFISFGKSFCESSSDKFNISPIKPQKGLTGKIRLMMSSNNYENLLKTFKCNSETLFNPEEKCKLW